MTSSDAPRRFLVVTADDFGIGPETSRGILDLAAKGVVTSTVLLVNSPFAEEAVGRWRKAGSRLEVGWHPCLTLDAPLLPPEQVPSLVGPDGFFLPLGQLMKRLLGGRVNRAEIAAEFRAQYERFLDLTGSPPQAVNAHHHIHVFRAVGDALAAVLSEQDPRPFVRRVRESARTLLQVPGARTKRLFLDRLGRRAAKRQGSAGLPGNEVLVGITDPPFVHDLGFFLRWLRLAPGQFVELSCHPGHFDPTLDGRDGTFENGHLHRRPSEFAQLNRSAFLEAAREAGFELVSGADLVRHRHGLPELEMRRAA